MRRVRNSTEKYMRDKTPIPWFETQPQQRLKWEGGRVAVAVESRLHVRLHQDFFICLRSSYRNSFSQPKPSPQNGAALCVHSVTILTLTSVNSVKWFEFRHPVSYAFFFLYLSRTRIWCSRFSLCRSYLPLVLNIVILEHI